MIRKANLLYIFQTGYGYISLPLSLLSLDTTLYYLMVNNIPFLKGLFPRFEYFIVFSIVVGLPVTLMVGWWYINSELNKASTRLHPFSTTMVPTQITQARALANVCRRLNLDEDAAAIDKLVEESERAWQSK